ncbi:MAG: C40 family peptidase [Gammaproteobacteria bacterium]|nr:C40 family peptidase [Gammaproteobacteria bacterium]
MISHPARIIRSLILIVAVASIAAGCSANETVPVSGKQRSTSVVQPSQRNALGDRAAAIALQQLGTPYRYGGNNPNGFDCSGLVHYSYAKVGKNIPRTTSGQWTRLRPVDDRYLQAGDLLFFNIAGKMSHVGIYLGQGEFVHAPSSGKVVSVESLASDYYRNAFIRAGRP